MTSNEPKSGNIVLVVAFIFAALVALLMLFNYAAFGQTNMGPIKTNQINQDLFVGQSGYATIQSAVNFGCKTGNKNFRVVIPAGATPSDTPTAITGGCTATYIDDKRTNNEALYSWNGTAYVINPPPTGGGDGGGAAPAQVPYAFNFTDETLQKLAATANATYDPATNTITFNTTFVQTNGYFGFSIFHPETNVPDGNGDDGQGIGTMSTGNSGAGKNIGNPPGIMGNGWGWRTIHGPQWLTRKIASGIGNAFEVTLDASAALGDSKAFSIGHSSAGGCQAASDECFAMATFGGGQGPEYIGTVVSTKGQGDTTPLFSGPVINLGFIEDFKPSSFDRQSRRSFPPVDTKPPHRPRRLLARHCDGDALNLDCEPDQHHLCIDNSRRVTAASLHRNHNSGRAGRRRCCLGSLIELLRTVLRIGRQYLMRLRPCDRRPDFQRRHQGVSIDGPGGSTGTQLYQPHGCDRLRRHRHQPPCYRLHNLTGTSKFPHPRHDVLRDNLTLPCCPMCASRLAVG